MTIREIGQAEVILRAAQTCAKIAWTNKHGDILYGHARSVGNDRGSFANSDEDFRELYLRITTQGGFETFLPVRDLMQKVDLGEFAIYDW